MIIGLICGSDGVATLHLEDYFTVAGDGEGTRRVSCVRRHREHFEIYGPGGELGKKVAPSNWKRILTACQSLGDQP